MGKDNLRPSTESKFLHLNPIHKFIITSCMLVMVYAGSMFPSRAIAEDNAKPDSPTHAVYLPVVNNPYPVLNVWKFLEYINISLDSSKDAKPDERCNDEDIMMLLQGTIQVDLGATSADDTTTRWGSLIAFQCDGSENPDDGVWVHVPDKLDTKGSPLDTAKGGQLFTLPKAYRSTGDCKDVGRASIDANLPYMIAVEIEGIRYQLEFNIYTLIGELSDEDAVVSKRVELRPNINNITSTPTDNENRCYVPIVPHEYDAAVGGRQYLFKVYQINPVDGTVMNTFLFSYSIDNNSVSAGNAGQYKIKGLTIIKDPELVAKGLKLIEEASNEPNTNPNFVQPLRQ